MYWAHQQRKKMESLSTNIEELPKKDYYLNDADALRRYRPLEPNLEVPPNQSMNSLGSGERQFNSYNSFPSNYVSMHQPSDAHNSLPESLNKPPTQPALHLVGDRIQLETRSHSHPLSSMKKTEEFRLDSMGGGKPLSSNIGVEPESINLDAHQNSMNRSLRSGPPNFSGPLAVPSRGSGQNLGDKLVSRNRSAVMGTVAENENKAAQSATQLQTNHRLQRGPFIIAK